MTPEREQLLADAWRFRQDRAALDELVRQMEGLNSILARRWHAYGVELDDLLAVGRRGVMRAVEKFDSAQGRFSTYARYWIFAEQGRLVYGQHLHGMTEVPFTNSSKQQAFHGLGRSISCLYPPHEHLDRLAGKARHAPRTMEAWVSSLGSHRSLNAPLSSRSDTTWQDTLREPSLGPQEAAEALERTTGIRGLASIALACLHPRQRLVVELRFLSKPPLTLQAIATELGLSRERVRQIEEQALKKMRKVLQVDR